VSFDYDGRGPRPVLPASLASPEKVAVYVSRPMKSPKELQLATPWLSVVAEQTLLSETLSQGLPSRYYSGWSISLNRTR
jgi:hypothetical protein